MKRKKRAAPVPRPAPSPSVLPTQLFELNASCAQLLAGVPGAPLEPPTLLIFKDSLSTLGARVVAPGAPAHDDLIVINFPRAWISSYPTTFVVNPREGYPCEVPDEIRPVVFPRRDGFPGVRVSFPRLSLEKADSATHVTLAHMSFAGTSLLDGMAATSAALAANHAKADKGRIWAAAAAGDSARLALELGSGGSTEEADWIGGTPITVAARNGHLEAVRILAAAGAQIAARKKRGSTLYLWDKSAPLIDAAKHGHLDVVRFLVTLPRMNINARYYLSGDSALHTAAQHGHLDVVNALLAVDGVEPDALCHLKATPLHLAVSRGHAAIVARLLADPRVDFHLGEKNFGAAFSPALHRAAWAGHDDLCILRALLEDPRVNINAADQKEGRTALHNTAGFDYAPWKGGYIAAAKMLMADPRTDVTAEDDEGLTPLHLAAHHGRDPLVALLLAHASVDPNARSKRQWTPLHKAACRGHASTVGLLLADARVDVNATAQNFNPDKKPLVTALDLARQRWEHDVTALLEADPRVAQQ